MANQKKIQVTAEIQAQVSNLNQTVQQLQNGLNKVNFDFNKNKGFSKLFGDFKEEYSKFQNFTKNGEIDLLDAKETIKSGEKVLKLFKEIQRVYGDLDSMELDTARKLFPDSFKRDLSEINKALNQYDKELKDNNEVIKDKTQQLAKLENAYNKQKIATQDAKDQLTLAKKQLDLTKQSGTQVEATINGLNAEITNLKNKLNSDLGGRNFKDIEDNANNADKTIKKLNNTIIQNNAVIQKGYDQNKIDDLALKYDQAIKGRTSSKAADIRRRLNNQKKNRVTQAELDWYKQYNDVNSDINHHKILTRLNEEKTKKTKVQEAQKQNVNLQSQVQQQQQILESEQKILETYNDTNKELEKKNKLLKEANATQAEIFKTETKQKTEVDKKNIDYKSAKAEQDRQLANIETLKKEIASLQSGQAPLDKLFETLNKLGANPQGLAATEENLRKIKEDLNNTDSETLKTIKDNLMSMGVAADEAEQMVNDFRQSLEDTRDAADEINRSTQEMENLKNQVLQFFSLTNGWEVFKRAVRSAFEAVKELDVAMTEIAVVSDFDIGDLWGQLPQFTKIAKELGVAIYDVYEATTLYVQQGLDLNTSLSMATETMKMARIAGLEGAEATQAMTAAVRAFGMALDEVSAKRVNDVYSKLAAISAADVEGISTAMTKAASIAASANMEFETTAALLTQIIETTQEAPEVAKLIL